MCSARAGVQVRIPLLGRRPQLAGPLRSAGRQPNGPAMGDARRARRSRPATPSTASGRSTGAAIYTTNGALMSVVQRSTVGKPVPDLFCYALLTDFRGYQPGYSKRDPQTPRLPHLGGAERAHEQPRRLGQDRVGEPAGPAGDQLPLLRRGDRCIGRRPARDRGGHSPGPPPVGQHEAAADRRRRATRRPCGRATTN